MRAFVRDLLKAWLVLLMMATGTGAAFAQGAEAGRPGFRLCGAASPLAMRVGAPGETDPDHDCCLDCAQVSHPPAAAPAPFLLRLALKVPRGAFAALPRRAGHRPAARGIRAPPGPA